MFKEPPHNSRIERDDLIKAFNALLPADSVLHEAEDLRPYECDGLSAYTRLPLVVVLPSSIEQVQQILQFCYENHVPVVARGAGTGLSGGALPHEQGVLLSLAKFKKILHVDPVRRIARIQPGVRNLAISQAADKYGLYTHRIPRHKSLAPLVEMSPKTPVVFTA